MLRIISPMYFNVYIVNEIYTVIKKSSPEENITSKCFIVDTVTRGVKLIEQ